MEPAAFSHLVFERYLEEANYFSAYANGVHPVLITVPNHLDFRPFGRSSSGNLAAHQEPLLGTRPSPVVFPLNFAKVDSGAFLLIINRTM